MYKFTKDNYYDEPVEVTMPRRLAIKLKHILSKNPDADVEGVEHGKWLKNNTECSVCGELNPTQYLDNWDLEYKAFYLPRCPHCGAKMDGKENPNGRKKD